MDDNAFDLVPFLTREMLKFGKNSSFELRITSIADAAIAVLIRGITRAGIISFNHTSSAASERSSTTARIDDIPTLISVSPVSTSSAHGRIWISLDLIVNGDLVFPLVAGFMSSAKGLSWPNSNILDTMPGRGRFQAANSTNPAAGSEASISVTANELWRIIGGSVTLVTDGNAANRRVHLQIVTSTGPSFDFFGNVDQTATQTRTYTFAPLGAIPDEIDDDDIIVPISNDLWVDGEGLVRTQTTNRQAGDDFSLLSLFVEKFYNGG